MSAPSAMASPSAALIAETVSAHRGASRSSTPTLAPSRASRFAQAAPMPAAAPVTRATFSDMIWVSVSSGGGRRQANDAAAVDRIRLGPVQHAGVVPDQHVTDGPLVAIDEPRLGGPFDQLLQQRLAFRLRHAGEV